MNQASKIRFPHMGVERRTYCFDKFLKVVAVKERSVIEAGDGDVVPLP